MDAGETQAEYDEICFREDLNRKQDAKNNDTVLITLILQQHQRMRGAYWTPRGRMGSGGGGSFVFRD